MKIWFARKVVLLLVLASSAAFLAFAQPTLTHAQAAKARATTVSSRVIPGDPARCAALRALNPALAAASSQGCVIEIVVKETALTDHRPIDSAGTYCDPGGPCIPLNYDITMQYTATGEYQSWSVEQDTQFLGDSCTTPQVVPGTHYCYGRYSWLNIHITTEWCYSSSDAYGNAFGNGGWTIDGGYFTFNEQVVERHGIPGWDHSTTCWPQTC